MATIYQNGIQYSGSGEPLIYDDMGGATSTTGGVHGLVPAPSAGDNEKFLSGDGSWKSAGEYITKTAEGNPITFTDGANAPLVKCVSAITGSQDLHGYDKPWVGGSGKNKLPMTVSGIKAINTDGSWSGNAYTLNGVTFTIETDGNDNVLGIAITGTSTNIAYFILDSNFNSTMYSGYIISGLPTNGSAQTYLMRITSQSSFVAIQDILLNNTEIVDNGNGLRLSIRIADSYTISTRITFYPMLRASGTTADFAPYSNICPITAYTDGEIEVRGKNLFNANGFVSSYSSNYQIASDGSVETISSLLVNNVFWNNTDDYEGNLTISYKYKYINTGSVGLRLKINYADGTSETVSTINSQTYNTITKTTTKKVSNIVTDYGSGTNMTNFYLMVVTGDRAYDYEPYTSTTHTTTYPSAIYRGSEDVVNGEVSAEKLVYTISDDTGVQGLTALTNVTRVIIDINATQLKSSGTHISNYLEYIANYTLDEPHFYFDSNNRVVAFFPGVMTGDQWRTYVANNPLQIAYEVNPTTSSVTPTNLPIKSLNGYSHIESSTGEMEIEYITSKYSPITEVASRQISAVEKLLELMITANREEEMKATQNYTAGDLLIVSGKLYKASSNIANGSTLVINSNVTSTTIAAELAALA